jgi:membrane-bound hydrogenase subunit beta
MNAYLTPERVNEVMKAFGPAEQVRFNRISIRTTPGQIGDAIRATEEALACDRLITISTADNGSTLELVYHMTGPHCTIVSLHIDLPRDRPEVMTVSGMHPAAGIYERQIHDLFGILFTGNKNLAKIMLNEDWPDGEYPLRKDWKPGPDTFYGGIKVERDPK